MTLIEHLSRVDDPRRAQGKRTSLEALFSMIIISNLCGHFGGRKIAKFTNIHKSTFMELLSLKHRPPSHVTFSDIINRVDEEQLIDAFNAWTEDFIALESKEAISGDGKALASTTVDAQNKLQKFTAIVSLFCQKSGLVYAVAKYKNQKESEINVVRFLINQLKDMGVVIFLDALHCQKKTADNIVESGNDYVLQAKLNQKTLFREIADTIALDIPLDYHIDHEKQHGRHSTWYVYVFDATNSHKAEEWRNLRRFIHVHKVVIDTATGKESHSDRFYISSCFETNAAYFHQGIRGHWTIENSLHWVKDVIHKEDKNRIRTQNGPVNSSIFSSIAINLQRAQGKRSITEAQIECNANMTQLFELIRT